MKEQWKKVFGLIYAVFLHGAKKKFLGQRSKSDIGYTDTPK